MIEQTKPPAVVRGAVQELAASLRILVANIRISERAALEKAIHAGAVVKKMKDTCEAGEFLASLEKAGLSQQRASEYRRLYEADITGGPVISDCDSIQSALEKIRLHKAPDPTPAPSPAQVRDRIKEGRKKAAEKAAEETGEKDDFGNAVPKRCLDAWKDRAVREARDTLLVIEDQLRQARLVDAVQKRAKAYPFLNVQDLADGIGFAMNYLDQCAAHLRDNIPAGVCPSCSGAGCGDCRQSGLVPREVYELLSKRSA
jgi:hypothetical protein